MEHLTSQKELSKVLLRVENITKFAYLISDHTINTFMLFNVSSTVKVLKLTKESQQMGLLLTLLSKVLQILYTLLTIIHP